MFFKYDFYPWTIAQKIAPKISDTPCNKNFGSIIAGFLKIRACKFGRVITVETNGLQITKKKRLMCNHWWGGYIKEWTWRLCEPTCHCLEHGVFSRLSGISLESVSDLVGLFWAVSKIQSLIMNGPLLVYTNPLCWIFSSIDMNFFLVLEFFFWWILVQSQTNRHTESDSLDWLAQVGSKIQLGTKGLVFVERPEKAAKRVEKMENLISAKKVG